ncbi:glycosyltransferase family 2 protein [Paenibacillus brasilensis]|uniref:GT2 family glycosyltransferase n=1 Tax=Paenibacillus brasilensis TaxID=128574 RepID=A0ABU0KWX6_9BACL|nr:glycosyltransferase family 2 protein [Paenibacillus brasilensis]MDQ0492743.1 GT2 family glycosyltransferase [Paenibacillus brasilensis]
MIKSVSVHIVTYNSEKDIRECLKAVSKQSFPPQEVVIIDNQSKDQTGEQVKEIAHLFGTKLKFVSNAQNVGFAPGHNQAIALNDTDYVLVLNPDVTIEPDYIERLVAVMEHSQCIGSATGQLLRKTNRETIDSTGIVMNSVRRAFDRGAGEPSVQWSESGKVFGVSGAAAMYSRRMINDITLNGEFYDGSFFAYKEDVDVAWRAALLGWEAYYDAAAIAYHERGWKETGRTSQPLFLRRLSYINRYKMMYKNDTFSYWMRNIISFLSYEVASNLYFLFREPKVLVAWKTFFKELPELRGKRRQLRKKIALRHHQNKPKAQ